jgi:hypothetical protein
MNVAMSWDITPSCLAHRYRRFGKTLISSLKHNRSSKWKINMFATYTVGNNRVLPLFVFNINSLFSFLTVI